MTVGGNGPEVNAGESLRGPINAGPPGSESARGRLNRCYQERNQHGFQTSGLRPRYRALPRLLAVWVVVVVVGNYWDHTYAMGDPPPPVQSSLIDTAREWWDWWWGIRPKVKSRREYLGGNGSRHRGGGG